MKMECNTLTEDIIGL